MFASILALAIQAPSFDLHLLPSGTFELMHGYRPYGIKFSDSKPSDLKNAPEVSSPKYGYIAVGDAKYLVEWDGADKLYVDTNGNGDLTDDPAPEWAMKSYKGRDGSEHSSRQGKATVDLNYEGTTVPCTVGIYQTPNGMGYYMDFSLTGKATIGGKSYSTIYMDEAAKWDGKSGLMIIDADGKGEYGPKFFHPAGRPFTLDGKEYEFGQSHGTFALLPSTKKIEDNPVEEDPNLANGLRQGKISLPFDATALSGNKLDFPTSFRGKVVLLDFWATWCGPCMAEVPNVAKNYAAYHDKGFEILGISLDRENAADHVKDVAKKNGMTWDQVYDGKYFDTAIAKKYKIQAIPEAYLIDGDTGKILANGMDIRGAKLGPAIEKALAAKGGK